MTVQTGKYFDTVYPEEGKPTADDLHINGELMKENINRKIYLFDGILYSCSWKSSEHGNNHRGWFVSKYKYQPSAPRHYTTREG